jgi:hypothetical protein
MNEFRIASRELSNPRRERKIRLILWGVVLALSVISLFAVYDAHAASVQLNTALVWVAVLIIIGAIVGANFFAARMGIQKAERDLVIVLTERDLIRRRTGWPDVRIGLAEIKFLYERPGWLLVESVEPSRKIAVPARVEGFGLLREQLAKYGPVGRAPERSALGLVPMVASFVCWMFVLWSKDPGIVKGSGILGLVLLGWESFQLNRKLHDSPKRAILLSLIGLSWVAALILVYLRMVRG